MLLDQRSAGSEQRKSIPDLTPAKGVSSRGNVSNLDAFSLHD
jgi:hypothetical protein